MNSSEKAMMSAWSLAAAARAARARSRLPETSPTIGLSCATAMARRSAGRSGMVKRKTDNGGRTTDKTLPLSPVFFFCRPSSVLCRPLHPRPRRQRLGLALAFGLEQIGEQEGEVERLLGIEARIADRVIAVVQILVADGTRAAGAFGDVLSGHFQMHAAGNGAFGGVNLKKCP